MKPLFQPVLAQTTDQLPPTAEKAQEACLTPIQRDIRDQYGSAMEGADALSGQLVRTADGRNGIIGECIGRGGFADVRLVTLGDSIPVAGKFLHPDLQSNERITQYRQRMENERDILRSLDMPGVPRFLGHGMAHDCPFILMEHICGHNWRQIIRTADALPLHQRMAHCREIASVIADLHSRGVVHSDIKPDNILLGVKSGDEHVRNWLIDFGLARRVDTVITRITVDGQTVGTHGYLDPRMVGKAESRNFASDMFSLGSTLYEMYAGMPVFSEGQWREVLSRQSALERMQESQEGYAEWFNTLTDQAFCRLQSQTQRHLGFEELLRSMLRYEQDFCRPDAVQVLQEISAFVGESRAADRKKFCSTMTIGAVTSAAVVAIAALIGTMHRESSSQSKEPVVQPSQKIERTPERGFHCTVDTEKIDCLHDGRLLFTAELKKDAACESTLVPKAKAWAVPIAAAELCQVLESGKPGLSAGLPKRQYTAYVYGIDDAVLISLTRACLLMKGSETTFIPSNTPDPSAELNTFLSLLQGPGRVFDKAAMPGPDGPKLLQRMHDHLRQLQKQAQNPSPQSR